ncbi:hypothetical protein [Fischerella sp. PCC 9605]|uniref:hypothetical protein n=1 Tax=Fischerella sp. PCC 9605 TaxID=1173024 RepID=UPI0004ACF73A|nr:hypothetical protein [Fischerella sp. PCC 9605]
MRTNVGLTNPSLFSPTDVDLTSPSVFSPVVFRPGFNHFEKINATQAWSLFFTGGREDKALGLSPTVGRFYNLSLIAIAIAGILWTFLFRPF